MSNTELVQSYRQQINNTVNQFNLQLFWNMYNRCQIWFLTVTRGPGSHKHTRSQLCCASFSRRDLDMNRSGTVLNAKTLK